MNKIFKLKKSGSGLKVVSEIAKSHGSGLGSVIKAGAFVGTLGLATVSSLYGDNTLISNSDGNVSNGNDNNLLIGGTTTTTNAGGDNIIAIGANNRTGETGGAASAGGHGSIAIGARANATSATDGQNIALGEEAESSGGQSIAIGGNTIANGYGAIAIGGDDIGADPDSVKADLIKGYAEFMGGDDAVSDRIRLIHKIYTGEILKVNADKSLLYIGTKASGLSAIALGQGSVASGTFSNALGFTNMAEGIASTAIGTGNEIKGNGANALGLQNKILDSNSSAIGISNSLNKGAINSTVLGVSNTLSGRLSTVVGTGNKSTQEHSLVVGTDNLANGQYTAAIGVENNATDFAAFAVGGYNQAKAKYSTAFGFTNTTEGDNSMALGIDNNITAQGDQSVAIGMRNTAKKSEAIAFGIENKAFGESSMAFGEYNEANADMSIAIGSGNNADGMWDVSFGFDNNVSSISFGYAVGGENILHDTAVFSMAEGFGNEVKGASSATIGNNNIIHSDDSIAVGQSNILSGEYATAIGAYNEITGDNSIAIGVWNENYGDYAMAMGYMNDVRANQAMAFGMLNEIGEKADYGLAQGYRNEISGDSSIGLGSYNIVSGATSAGIGLQNKISGESSFVFGFDNNVEGRDSIAIGYGHQILGSGSGAFGDPTYIDADDSYAIGNDNSIAAGNNSVFILGNNVTKTHANSVFLGEDSAYVTGTSTAGVNSYATNAQEIGNIKAGDLKFAGTSPVGVVSVGSVGNERRIQNIAAGLIEAGSTDAINGSQLYSAIEKLSIKSDNRVVRIDVDDDGSKIVSPYIHINGVKTADIMYNSAQAHGANAIAIGDRAYANGANGVSIGTGSRSTGESAVAFMGASAIGDRSMVWGYNGNIANGNYSTAFGYNTRANLNYSTAFGYNTIAEAASATAWGSWSRATGFASTAFGYLTAAGNGYATAWGENTKATGVASTAFGSGTDANNTYATAWGQNTKAYGQRSTAFGSGTEASASNAVAWGSSSKATGNTSTAFGHQAEANASNAVAWGENTKAGGSNSTAFGFNTTVTGNIATAWGDRTKANGSQSTAWGFYSIADGQYSTAFGQQTKATAEGSTAWGIWSDAEGSFSTAFGRSSKVYAENALGALGGIVAAEASNSAAIGKEASVTVANTVALGSNSKADRTFGAIYKGYDVQTNTKGSENTKMPDDHVWKATANAIAVGDADNKVTRQITGVAAGSEDTDAVNVAQLKRTVGKITVNGGTVAPADGNYTEGNLQLALGGDDNNTYDLKLNKDLNITDGSIFVGNGDTNTTIDNKGITITNNGDNITTTINVKNGDTSLDGNTTRIIYTNSNGDEIQVATMGDGLIFKGDDKVDINKTLGKTLTIVGEADTADDSLTTGNIAVVANNAKDGLVIKLAKAINLGDGNLTIGNPSNPIFISDSNVSMGDNIIHNVGAGVADTDAVNVSQLKNSIDGNATTVASANGSVGVVESTKDGHKHYDLNITDTMENLTTIIGGNSVVNDDNKTITVTNIGNTGENNIHDAIQKAYDRNDTVKSGDQYVTVERNRQGSENGNDFTVKVTLPTQYTDDTNSTIKLTNNIDDNNVTLTNVAAGVNDTDAVNVSQLKNVVEGNKTKVTVNGGTVAPTDGSYTEGNLQLAWGGDNNNTYDLKLAKDLDLTDGSIKLGDNTYINKTEYVIGTSDGNTTVTADGITINKNGSTVIKIVDGNISMGDNIIHNVGAGVADTDAVNVSQLKNAVDKNRTKVTINGGVVAGTNGTYAGSNLLLTQGNESEGNYTYDLKLGDIITVGGNDGNDGNITVVGKDGRDGVSITAKDGVGTIGINGKDGKNADITIGKGDDTLKDNEPGRIIYTTTNKNGDNITLQVATLDDGMKFDGNYKKGTSDPIAKNLNDTMTIKGTHDQGVDKLSNGNIGVINNGNDLIIELAKSINLGSDGSLTIGNTTINNDGIVINNTDSTKTIKITNGDINMGGNKITNVTAGTDDTDVVNVSQLNGNTTNITNIVGDPGTTTNPDGSDNGDYKLKTYDVSNRTGTINTTVVDAIDRMNKYGIKFFHTNDGTNSNGGYSPHPDDASAGGKYATAVGYQADANGENSLAIGNQAAASGTNSIAIGTGNQVFANNAGAFGDPNTVAAGADGSYVIGNNNNVATKDTFVMGNGVTSTVENSLFFGSNSAYVADDGTRTKGNSKGYNSATMTAKNANGEDVTIGMKQFAGGDQVVGVVSVGNANETRRIQGVAPGLVSKDSTDAINGSQLYSALEGVAENLGGQINQTNNAVNNLAQQLGDARKEARGGIASAIAIGNLPQSTIPGKGMLSAGVGYFKDEGSLSLGLSKMSDNGKWVFKSSLSVDTQENVGAGLSLGFHF